MAKGKDKDKDKMKSSTRKTRNSGSQMKTRKNQKSAMQQIIQDSIEPVEPVESVEPVIFQNSVLKHLEEIRNELSLIRASVDMLQANVAEIKDQNKQTVIGEVPQIQLNRLAIPASSKSELEELNKRLQVTAYYDDLVNFY